MTGESSALTRQWPSQPQQVQGNNREEGGTAETGVLDKLSKRKGVRRASLERRNRCQLCGSAYSDHGS